MSRSRQEVRPDLHQDIGQGESDATSVRSLVRRGVAVSLGMVAALSTTGLSSAFGEETHSNATVQLCEEDALGSYSYSPTANTFKYVPFHGQTNKVIRWTIRMSAMPSECQGEVRREVGVQELIGVSRDHLVPNNTFEIVNKGNSAVNEQIDQGTINAYQEGEYIQGVVDILAYPLQGGGQPAVGQHRTTIAYLPK